MKNIVFTTSFIVFLLFCPSLRSSDSIPQGYTFLYTTKVHSNKYTLVYKNLLDYANFTDFLFVEIDTLGKGINIEKKSIDFAHPALIKSMTNSLSYYAKKLNKVKSNKDSLRVISDMKMYSFMENPFHKNRLIYLDNYWFALGNYDMIEGSVVEINSQYLAKFDKEWKLINQRYFEDDPQNPVGKKIFKTKDCVLHLSVANPFNIVAYDYSGEWLKNKPILKKDYKLQSVHALNEEYIVAIIQKDTLLLEDNTLIIPNDFIYYLIDSNGNIAKSKEDVFGSNKKICIVYSLGLKNESSLFIGQNVNNRKDFDIINMSKHGDYLWSQKVDLSLRDSYDYTFLELNGYILVFSENRIIRINSSNGKIELNGESKYENIRFIDFVDNHILFCYQDHQGNEYVARVSTPSDLIK